MAFAAAYNGVHHEDKEKFTPWSGDEVLRLTLSALGSEVSGELGNPCIADEANFLYSVLFVLPLFPCTPPEPGPKAYL